MCKWETETLMEVTIPAHLSHTGKARRAVKGIDACLAPLVKALNEGGITTASSCCGHGKEDGVILLADGRQLIAKQRSGPYAELVREVERLTDENIALKEQRNDLLEHVEVLKARKP